MKRLMAIGGTALLVLASCGSDDAATDTTNAPDTLSSETTPAAPDTDAPAETTAEAPSGSITLVTNDAFSSIASVLDSFTEETGIEVTLVAGGDAGTLVNQAILTKDNPLGDVLFGFDNTFLSRVLSADIAIPYRPAAADDIPAELILDPEFRATPTDIGDVCINYDKAWLAENGIAVPETMSDLIKPEYKGLLVVENPATSSPGAAFMMGTIAEFGEDGWLDFWRGLRENDVEVVSGWDEAYYTSFSGSAGKGPRPLVVSYATSPPAEVIFADPPIDEAPTGVMEASCFRQIEFISILKGTDNEPAAQALVDWWLSDSLQAQLPLNYFVFPAMPDTEIPQEFIDFSVVPESPLSLPPEDIAANREEWLDQWTSTVLR